MCKYVKVNNTWFINDFHYNNYGSVGYSVYIMLLRNYTIRDSCVFSLSMLYSDFKVLSRGSYKSQNDIKLSLLNMNNHVFTIYEDRDMKIPISNNQIDKDKIYYITMHNEDKYKFTILYDQEIDSIINGIKYKKGFSIYKAISCFGYLMMYIGTKKNDKNYKVCYPTFDKISQVLNISKPTIDSYNKLLKNCKVLAYDNTLYNIGLGKSECNTYSRFCDVEYLNKYIDKKSERNTLIRTKKSNQSLLSKQKSIKQKINYWKRKYNNDKNNINEQEWQEVHNLETQYVNIVHIRGLKLKRGMGLWTYKLDGSVNEAINSS